MAASTVSTPQRGFVISTLLRLYEAMAWRWWYFHSQVCKGVLFRLHHFPSVFATWWDGIAYARTVLSLQRVHSTTKLQIKKLHGRAILCRPSSSDSGVLWDTFYHCYHEPPPNVREPKCIVDLGANVGYTAAHYAATYPQARIVAVEMDEENHRLAIANTVTSDNRCQVIRAAIWNKDGIVEYSGTEQHGYRVCVLEGATESDKRHAPARSLDSIFDELQLTYVDFVKMDIEGAEAIVFAGSLKWLTKVGAIKIELHPPMTFDECCQILESNGFQCQRDKIHPRCVVAVRRDGR